MTDEAVDQSHPDLKTKWRNMRYMSYIALAISAIITGAVIYQGFLKDALDSLLIFYSVIIGGYMGFSTARDGWGKK